MSEERKGFFGLFKGSHSDSKEATASAKPEEVDDWAATFLQTLLDKMGLFTVVKTSRADAEEISLEIKGDEMGIIIGKEGTTLNSLQLFINSAASKKFGVHPRISLDAEEYRQKRKAHLEEIAKKAADTASQSGREIMLDPMPPAERRIVHLSLQEDKRVTTRSIGRGADRKVVVGAVKRKDNFFLP